jgi:uncharacterized protein (TIGR03083 family)
MDYSGKDTVLDVIRTERGNFYDIIDDPNNWNVQTRCTEWEVRDMVGHMIHVTEGYLTRWDMARKGKPADAVGLLVMGESLNENAQKFRSLPRQEAIARLKTDSDQMLTTFDALTEQEWSGFNVTHPYMGPLPTLFYPAFHVMDYGVHTWDMRWGLGDKYGKLDERTAGVLVPFMFVLDGEWGGQWKVTVKDGAFSAEPAESLEGTEALFHFKDASDFVLTAFQRFPGGETSGDPKVIDQIRHLFFRI